MERINIPGFGPGSLENDIYTFDVLPGSKFERVGDAFQPIVDGFYVGQEVWCELFCQVGTVSVLDYSTYPIGVVFSDHKESYTADGRYRLSTAPTLKPLQKFNVGQRVKDGNGKTGVVISNTFHGVYNVLVQWDTANQSYLNQLDGFTSIGLFDCDIVMNDKNISHA